ncbi:MAG: AIR carboxylase family protein [Parasutterella sp.]
MRRSSLPVLPKLVGTIALTHWPVPPFAKKLNQEHQGSVAVVSAGTADGFVTWEAARTLEFMNIPYQVFEDCGVAGLWRLESKIEEINRHRIIIAVAGMEAALGSVLAGLTSRPIIGVPHIRGVRRLRRWKNCPQ